MVASEGRGLECPAAIILSDTYFIATADYFEAVDRLCGLVGAHEEFKAAKKYTNQMHVKCQTARSALEKHRVEHGCFTAS
jgi:hypothetical protein